MISFRNFIEFAEKQISLAHHAKSEGRDHSQFTIPSLIMSWCAIECFVNNRMDDFDSLPNGMFTLYERAFLTERKVEFIPSGENAGQFEITGTAYRRLSDKITFLLAKTGNTVDKSMEIWRDFDDFKKVRDALIHPKQQTDTTLEIETAEKFLGIAKSVIIFVSSKLGKPIEF